MQDLWMLVRGLLKSGRASVFFKGQWLILSKMQKQIHVFLPSIRVSISIFFDMLFALYLFISLNPPKVGDRTLASPQLRYFDICLGPHRLYLVTWSFEPNLYEEGSELSVSPCPPLINVASVLHAPEIQMAACFEGLTIETHKTALKMGAIKSVLKRGR